MNSLEQLGRPGTLAPMSYLWILWVSWAPRVSRVSRALLKYKSATTPLPTRSLCLCHYWELSNEVLYEVPRDIRYARSKTLALKTHLIKYISIFWNFFTWLFTIVMSLESKLYTVPYKALDSCQDLCDGHGRSSTFR